MAQAAERAYEAIRRDILDGAHPDGARLGEEDLATAIGVSRTPVREALRRLDAEGLVDYEPRRGARVASWSDQDLDEIFALRALLEGYAARLAAQRADRVDVAALRECCERMEAAATAGDLDLVTDLNRSFHGAITEAAGNRRLAALITAVVQVPLMRRTFVRYSPQALERSMNHHAELASALEAGDGEWAESVMRSHVLAARAALAEHAP